MNERLDTCGCCQAYPAAPDRANAPGQPSLRYRAGTHASFLAAMKARIHAVVVEQSRPLAPLTTREASDPAIALLDAWAVAADIVTFYQERIANEGFLRTATERRSVLALARQIGYELNPGVSAAAHLAFTVDDAEGGPVSAVVPAGTQVLSIPASQDERPQTFETAAEFIARVEWNALRPLSDLPHPLSDDLGWIDLAGTATGLRPGDVLVLVAGATVTTARVAAVNPDTSSGRTRVSFQGGGAAPDAVPPDLPAAVFDPDQPLLPLTLAHVETEVFGRAWRDADLQAFLALHGWDVDTVAAHVATLRAESFADPSRQVHALREKASFFGHNAPRWELLPPTATNDSGTVTERGGYDDAWDGSNARTIWVDSQGDSFGSEADAYLDRAISGVVPGGWVVFTAPGAGDPVAYQVDEGTQETSRSDFGLSGSVTALKLLDPDGTAPTNPGALLVRKTVARVASAELALAPWRDDSDLEAGARELWLATFAPGLAPGSAVVVEGEIVDATDLIASEAHEIEDVIHAGGYTWIQLVDPLARSYRRESVILSANVVLATHGEAVASEVLGSGDGSVANQAFALGKPPLTHVPAATARGAASTLTVRVDGVAWSEVPSLYDQAPDARVYTVRIGDDAKARVVFGDGKSGARLPSGSENVRASYRSGTGLAGEVGAGALSLLKTRPLGVRSVVNPLPASGGDDPETLDDARANAPLTVRTFERIVSLQDYADFARAYAGIGKARADVVWDGESERIHLTVADASGDPVVSPLLENLQDAVAAARDPWLPVVIASAQPALFSLSASVLIDDAYIWEDVKAAAQAAIADAFSFTRRCFAQPVTAAEVMAVLHTVAGVIAVDLDTLHLTDAAAVDNGVLPSAPARYDRFLPGIRPAELLLVHAPGIALAEMSS